MEEYMIDEQILSSGETVALEEEQRKFNEWFRMSDEDILWSFDADFDDDVERKRAFLAFIGEHIKSIPPYRYLVKFLMLRYKLTIGEKNEKYLWDYLENTSWKVKKKFDEDSLRNKLVREAGQEAVELTQEDYQCLLSILSAHVGEEYAARGVVDIINPKSWTTYFKKLITQFSESRLVELALALNLSLEDYKCFRGKALKLRSLNYLKYQDAIMYLTLRYAADCGESRFHAYKKLKELYPEKREHSKKMAESTSSVMVGRRIDRLLEKEGELAEEYRPTLFVKVIPELDAIFDEISLLAKSKMERTPQRVIKEVWNEFQDYVTNFHAIDIVDSIEKAQRSGEENGRGILGKHEIFRWLYGENVETQGTNRIIDLPDAKMAKIFPDDANYFLDSQEFLDTRIRDATFTVNFPKDEQRQRNLLLTAGFLNFVSTEDSEGTFSEEEYEQRLQDFEFEMTDYLVECGFMNLYSGNAYDAFLKLLLSCADSLDLFQYIWRIKTKSEV